jgi:hypothetical protein
MNRLFLQPRVLQGLLEPLAELRVVLVDTLEQLPLAWFDVGAIGLQIVSALVRKVAKLRSFCAFE